MTDRKPFSSIVTTTQTTHSATESAPSDAIKIIVVRAGAARFLSDFGCRHVNVGDVVLLAENTLCGAEPKGRITTTTLHLNRDYIVDLVFWKYSAYFRTRQDARTFLEVHYVEPVQVVRIGEVRAGMLLPLLDELTALSLEGLVLEQFYRARALLFSILDVVVPRLAATSRCLNTKFLTSVFSSQPRPRQIHPTRVEARRAANLLFEDLAHEWRVDELANRVYLSPSQLRRVFINAYGQSPIAFLTMLRAERMAELLRTTDLLVSVIASEVGWNDPEYAARRFRRSIGVSPRDYRRIILKLPLISYPE